MAAEDAAPEPNSADAVVLPPWQETFLARYSRNFKLGSLTFILAIIFLPWSLVRLIPVSEPEIKPKAVLHHTQVQGSDKAAASTVAIAPDQATAPEPMAGTTNNGAVLNDQDNKDIKLTPAPDPMLTEDTAQGTLPRIAENGRLPWQAYARPYNMADQRPRVAIVVADLGLSRLASDAAINLTPTNVTLAFDVQSPVVAAWSSRARQAGHEIIIGVPMEPFDFPRSDPGLNTLLTSLPNSDNLQRLIWSLRQSVGYIGITTFSGSRFTTDPEKMLPILDTLRQRGLMIFDSRVAPHSVIPDLAREAHVPTAVETVRIDAMMTTEAIDKALDRLEKDARQNGRAVGTISSTPLTLDRLQNWLKGLPDRGISLAPLSAVAK